MWKPTIETRYLLHIIAGTYVGICIMPINRFVSTVSLTKCIIFEYWQNIGRQNTLLAYIATVRKGFPVAMLFPKLYKAYYLIVSFSRTNARGFSAGARVFPSPKKNNISNFSFDLKINARSLLNNFFSWLILSEFVEQQISFTSFISNLLISFLRFSLQLRASRSRNFSLLDWYE